MQVEINGRPANLTAFGVVRPDGSMTRLEAAKLDMLNGSSLVFRRGRHGWRGRSVAGKITVATIPHGNLSELVAVTEQATHDAYARRDKTDRSRLPDLRPWRPGWLGHADALFE